MVDTEDRRLLVQQVLVAAMVLRAQKAGMSLRAISILTAELFGGFHLTLALDEFTALHVARFTLAVTIFGLTIPWLYLRARHGIRWAYGLHRGVQRARRDSDASAVGRAAMSCLRQHRPDRARIAELRT